MNQLNIKRIVTESFLILLGIKFIGFLIEPVFQLIKTESKDAFLDSLDNLFTIRRTIISLAIAVAFAIYKEKRRQKKSDQQADESVDA